MNQAVRDGIKQISLYADNSTVDEEALRRTVRESLAPVRQALKRVLLLPPDYTRLHSNAGLIAETLYQYLSPGCAVDIMPALGTHMPVSRSEWEEMFRSVPYENMIVHDWRRDVVRIGEVPDCFVKTASEGLMEEPVPIEINKRLLDKAYDLIVSIGQVVPHEVVGMSSHSKNIFVGCGGSSAINATHMLGAVCGLERLMGKDHSPVRRVLDYAADCFLRDIPLIHMLTVTTSERGEILTHGLFIGHERRFFEDAVKLSQQVNIRYLSSPVKKFIVYLDEKEYKSTWLGNKAIYRTRKAIADQGELIILAPGVVKFGEDETVDGLIRKYGYTGRMNVFRQSKENDDLKKNLSAAAHMIHGSDEGRFSITYCTRHLSREEVESVGFRYMPYDEAVKIYHLDALRDGWNTLPGGEKIYFVSNPALGLWTLKE